MSDITLTIVDSTPVNLSFAGGIPYTAGSGIDITGGVITATASGGLVYPAGENISAGKVVVIISGSAYMFQPSNSSHGGKAVGITTSSATTGNNISITISGQVTDAGFSGFTGQVLWVGDNGQIQTSFPSSGNIQKVGIGIGSNKVQIDFSTQITY